MATREEAIKELYKRDLLKPKQKEAYEELLRRQAVAGGRAAEVRDPYLEIAKIGAEGKDIRNLAFEEMAQEVGPLQALAIGAGKGFYDIGRGLGFAEPAGETEKQAFEELRRQRPYTTTAGEIAGQAAPLLPLAAIPGAGVATGAGRTIIPAVTSTAGRFATAGITGGLEGGIISRGTGQDAMVGTGVGAGMAVGAEILFPVLGRLGSKIFRRVTGKAPVGAMLDSAGRPTRELQQALDSAGMTFDDLTQDATEMIQRSGGLEPEQVARKAVLEEAGIDPTQAQITREAADFQAQQEAAKTSTKVRKRLEQQEAALISGFDEAIAGTGGTAVQSGSPVMDTVLGEALEVDRKIGQLYKAARERAAGSPSVSLSGLSETVKKMMPSNRLMKGVPEAIKGQLMNEGIIDKNFNVLRKATVEEAERVRQVANSVYSSTSPYGKRGIKEIKDEIDFDVTKSTGEDLFRTARATKAAYERALTGTKASKFSTRSREILRDIIEDKIDPDQFFDKVVLSKSVRAKDISDIKRFMVSGTNKEVGQSALNDLKAETMQWIKDKAFTGPIDDMGNQAMSRASFENALKKIGPEKMKVLFNPDERKFFSNLMTVAKLREPVRGTALGRGPSAQAISRIESLLKKIPLAGGLFEFVDFDAQGRAIIKAKPDNIYIPKTESQKLIPSTLAAAGTPAALKLTEEQPQTPQLKTL